VARQSRKSTASKNAGPVGTTVNVAQTGPAFLLPNGVSPLYFFL
jgi:hypothetical protein